MDEPPNTKTEWTNISTVEDVFSVSGRGLVVLPGVPAPTPGTPASLRWTVRVGDVVRLERPDGSKFETTIRGVEFARLSYIPRGAPREELRPLLLGSDLTKDMVPAGTKLWLRVSV